MPDIAPQRDEFTAYKPLDSEGVAPARNASAPWGYKKDGTPAKQRGRPAGYKLGSRTSSTKGSLRNQIGGFLLMVNTPLMMIPALQRDALDQVELDALAKALDDQCQQSPRFRKYMESMLKAQGTGGLGVVIAIIAARRAVRHDIPNIPSDSPVNKETLDSMLGSGLAMMTGQAPINQGIKVPEPTEVF